MKTGLKVCDVMTRQPVKVPIDTSLKQCAQIMNDNKVGALLITENDKVTGIVTEQDIVRKAVLNGMNSEETKVLEIMETNLIHISPEKDIFEALEVMKYKNIRHLPVIEENFLGLVTVKDILKVQPQLFQNLVDQFEIKESERKLGQ